MSVEQTLAERGQRYGDFADHAAIAQAVQDAMRLTRPNGWERLNDMQRQALTVIADKIARILSGDPNYADNWHDIQGYAKLVEDRLQVDPTRGDDKPVSCEPCGSTVPGWHKATCPAGGLAAFKQHMQRADAVAKPCDSDPLGQRGYAEPAAQIDDESDRQKAVEQNGNDGAVYEDPWYGAPEWARFKAQDSDGEWRWFEGKPTPGSWRWHDYADDSIAMHAAPGEPNPNWRDTLIERP